MRITVFLVKGTSGVDTLYKKGDTVELPDGTKGTVAETDPAQESLTVDVTDDPNLKSVKLKTPAVETPIKRV